MSRLFNGLIDCLLIALMLSVSLVVFILMSPLVLLGSFSNRSKRKQFERDYQQYLYQQDGSKFFCYNNRRASDMVIESLILPELSSDINVVFLNGKELICDLPDIYVSAMLHKIKAQVGFPYLLKIYDGKVIEQSLNNEFYNMINQGKDIDSLLKQINLFFDDNCH